MAIAWLALGIAAFELAKSRHLATAIAFPLALAFLTEISFYLLPGFPDGVAFLRERWSRVRLAATLALTGVLPYLVLSIPLGEFSFLRFLALFALMAAVAGWFLLPAGVVRNLTFLGILGAATLSPVFPWIYPLLDHKTPGSVLGHVTLIRVAILAVLLFDDTDRVRFGFIPTARELGIGAAWALAAAAVGVPLGLALHQIQSGSSRMNVWQSIGLVLAIFWVVALSEEFFFRALLQQWLADWTRSTAAGLLITCVVFGAAHLAFRGIFPNWRFALLAAVLGLFYGAAYVSARSMRASMVTHAIIVSAWRLFFR